MSLRLASLIILALAATMANGALAQHTERRVALVIGNADYKSVGALDNPVNDARDMATKLSGLGFEVLRVENGTKQQVERAIEQFSRKLGPDAVSLFYYAGHGLQVNGHNFLVPVDAKIEKEQTVRLETVDLDAVLDQMSAAKSRVNLVILDACRNNPFEQRFRSVSGGLASIDAPAGTLIAYATAPGKVAADGTGRNALYTTHLLRALDDPGLKVEDVFKHVRVAVSQATQGEQTPWESSSLTGDFYFRPDKQTSSVPPGQSSEVTFWDSIRDSSNPADFADYLRQYPAGSFRSLAERRLASLPQAAPSKPSPRAAPTQQQATLTPPSSPPASPPPISAPAPSSPAPSSLSGKWVAADKGACGSKSAVTIADGHITGYISEQPRDIAIDTRLGGKNEVKFAAGAGDRYHPYLFRVEGVFPNLVINGSSLCRGTSLTYSRAD
jgi:hypothetical protein